MEVDSCFEPKTTGRFPHLFVWWPDDVFQKTCLFSKQELGMCVNTGYRSQTVFFDIMKT